MKTLSLFLAFCLTVIAVHAQTNNYLLKGQVTDQNTNPVENVLVVNVDNSSEKAITDKDGLFTLSARKPIKEIKVVREGFAPLSMPVGAQTFVHIQLHTQPQKEELPAPIMEVEEEHVRVECDAVMDMAAPASIHAKASFNWNGAPPAQQPQWNTEAYAAIDENDFHTAKDEPLSTFSIDVDRASYTNVRRFINQGQLPPVDAVRIEEMVNYFDYEYAAPTGSDPVNIFTEVSQAPWNPKHQLLHVGIKAREMDKEDLPPSNLVFLIDVSGSMSSPNKLGLLKSGMKMLVDELREEDRVAMVVYAGAAGLVLESTSGADKGKIKQAIDRLNAGGSTAGGAGIKLAYKVAVDHFHKEGNNRVILATDGDFNVGASSDGEMQRLIEEKRELGVFLTVLGFGSGNYKDSKMETLADKGNGNYAYIDNITEAKKTLVNEFGGTLFAVAKDVKIQVEFNPANVAEYRLIGYENRKLNNEDFNDDKKDAGEMGVGHVVTALYEIIPAGQGQTTKVDDLKYQQQRAPSPKSALKGELATLKLRYKEPDGETSKLMSTVIKNDSKSIFQASTNLRWSASAASFGMLLRDSQHKGSANYAATITLAESALGEDNEGYRRECLQLMRSAALLQRSTADSR